MNTQIKRLIQFFCIMLFATVLSATYGIQTGQANLLSVDGPVEITDDGDDDGDDDSDDDSEFYGAIVSFPANLIGTWQVGNMTFIANQNTKFEQEGPLFAVGVIVEVEYVVIDGVNIATEIESDDEDSDSDDNDSDDGDSDSDSDSSHDNEIYGVIASFPSDLLGTWQVGGMTFTANQNTRFEQNRSQFATGLIVEVEYIVSNGINIATEIESDDDHINENKPPASGLITQMGNVTAASANNSSIWVIGGVSYQVTANTSLDGTLAVGKMASVFSYVDPNGTLSASQVSDMAMDNHIYLPMVLQ